MTRMKGFGALGIIIAIAIIAALGGGAYVASHPAVLRMNGAATTTADMQTAPGDHPEQDHAAGEGMSASGKIGVVWKFEDAGEKDNIPYTQVSLNGKVIGTYQGTCAEIGAEGGVDGKGLLAGELSGVQCWFAGGGDEIGLFAKEDGGTEVMVGSLSEPIEGAPGSRGDFKIRTDITM